MRHRSATAPQWSFALALGLCFCVTVAAVIIALDDERHLAPALLSGLVGGAVSGPFMGAFVTHEREVARAAIGPAVDDEQFARASRACAAGVVPGDPTERRAAAALLRYRLRGSEGRRGWTTWSLVLFAVLTANRLHPQPVVVDRDGSVPGARRRRRRAAAADAAPTRPARG